MAATTLNMHRAVLLKVSKAAAHRNVSRRSLIIDLLMRVLREHDSFMGRAALVKYQPDDADGNWHRFHIRFKQEEYEFFLDLRKICKCSVSLLLALAVDRYLCEHASVESVGVDKYIYFNKYILERGVLEGYICWHIYWGYEKNKQDPLRR